MDKKNILIVGLLCLVGFMTYESTQPKFPVLRGILDFAKRAIWVVPFVLDEEHQGPQVSYTAAPEYGAEPYRAAGEDGHVVIEHGDGW
jgi:hypothetical protein